MKKIASKRVHLCFAFMCQGTKESLGLGVGGWGLGVGGWGLGGGNFHDPPPSTTKKNIPNPRPLGLG